MSRLHHFDSIHFSVDYIAKNGKMSEAEARKMFWQIICAVDYCHQKGIVHRDLKVRTTGVSLLNPILELCLCPSASH